MRLILTLTSIRPLAPVLLACCLLGNCYGQIGKELFDALPDSIRPVKRVEMTTMEAARVINSVFKLPKRSKAYVLQTDNLCFMVGPKYSTLGNVEDRIFLLEAICRHLFNSQNLYGGSKISGRGRNPRFQSTAYERIQGLTYSNLLIDELERHRPRDYAKLQAAHGIRGFFLCQEDKVLDAMRDFRTGANFAKETGNNFNIGQSFLQIADNYERLGLPEQSLTYSDSAITYFRKLKTGSEDAKRAQATLIWEQQKAYLSHLRDKPTLAFAADSIRALHRRQIFDFYTKGRRRASSFIMVAGAHFYQKQYLPALSCIDSAEHASSEFEFLVLREDAIIYKGLSLLYLGREAEGFALLKSLDFENIHTPAILMALRALIGKYAHSHRFGELSHYQDLLIKYMQKRHLREMQGKSLEVKEQYDVAVKDYQIKRLQDLHNRNRWIAVSGSLICLSLLLYIWVRYDRNSRKTRRLLEQIRQETALEIIRVEDAHLQERRRLGQELHDSLASSIVVVLRYIKTKTDAAIPSEKQYLASLSTALEESYNVTRMQSARLFMEDSSKQFCDRLEEKTRLYFADTSIDFSFVGEISGIAISAEVKMTILLVAQEAITNIIKHAGATSASILLYSELEYIVFEISDNGKGMTHVKGKEGIGLKSIESRVAAVNGRIFVKPTLPRGATLVLNLPLVLDNPP